MMLISRESVDRIEIDTPADVRLVLPVTDTSILPEGVKCSVVKDGGDDTRMLPPDS
jgi:Cobalamin biosynthesis protein CbiD